MSSFLIKNKKEKSFEDKISKYAVKTKQNLISINKSFESFCNDYYQGKTSQDIFDELNTLKNNERTSAIREVLQSWIDWQYQNDSLTSSVQQYVSKIKRIFSHNGIMIHTSDFDESLEFKPRIKEELHELTTEEIQKIFQFASPKKLGLYLALSSTGARPSELLQVRKKDVDTTKKRIKIRIEAENVKTRSGRSIWLTKEAGGYLMMRLRKIGSEDLVWGTNENPSYSEKNESTIFSKICDKAGFIDRYKSNNFRKITLYSFRSFFFGKVSDVKREGYAHKMTGHGGYLPQYDRMSDEKKLEWFLECEPSLVIDSTKRDEIKIQQLESEKSELEQKNKRVEELEKRFDNELARDKEFERMKAEIIKELRDGIGKTLEQELKEIKDKKLD